MAKTTTITNSQDQNTDSPELKKRRQLLLILPLLILPFVTLAFWALGGGAVKGAGNDQGNRIGTLNGKTAPPITGINSVVPSAKNSTRLEDKMSQYAESDRLAAQRKEAYKEDQGRLNYAGRGEYDYDNQGLGLGLDRVLEQKQVMDLDADSISNKVQRKLEDLQRAIDKAGLVNSPSTPVRHVLPTIDPATYGLQPGESPVAQSKEQLDELARLNAIVAKAAGGQGDFADNADNFDEGQPSFEADSETIQINKMLDKILAIQQGGQKAGAQNAGLDVKKAKQGIYPVTLPADTDDVSVAALLPQGKADKLGTDPQTAATAISNPIHFEGAEGVSRTENKGKGTAVTVHKNEEAMAVGFFDIDGEAGNMGQGGATFKGEGEGTGLTMAAVIAETQTLVSGAAVKMRLNADINVHGTLVPSGNFVYGTCTLNGERLRVSIDHIRYLDQLFPVQLQVFDLDGMEGIRIPGSISRDAAKQGADQALQSVQMMSLDPSVSAQAATAAIEAAKGLLRKKVKLVRVTVKAGYPILLLDAKQLQQQAK